MKLLKKMKKVRMKNAINLLLAVVFLTGCEPDYTPKPFGNIRIDLPEKAYKTYIGDCPYSFDYIDFAELQFEKDCWINIVYKGYSGIVHLTYKPVEDNLERLMKESQELAFVHTVRADAIQSTEYSDFEKKVYGSMYLIEGNAATSTQFYATDSVKHFLRGVVYFNNSPNADSLAPVTDYVREDIRHLMETLNWAN